MVDEDIYFFSSLALFMVDAVHVIYLWHGWWPQSDEDSESRASTTGSAETRWSNDRRLAMETIKSYAEGISFCCTLAYVKPYPPPPPMEEQPVFPRGVGPATRGLLHPKPRCYFLEGRRDN